MASRGWEGVTRADLGAKGLPKQVKPSKYHAQATVVDGHLFDSKAEARRYSELRLLEKAGKITGLVLQPRFSLRVPSHHQPGEPDRGWPEVGEYVADFAYDELDVMKVTRVVEDVKGAKTLALARWKQKHLFIQYGIVVKEIRYR